MIFDTHAHYSDEKYNEDREDLLCNMHDAGVEDITLIGASLAESRAEKELAIRYSDREGMPRLYFTVGDHPDEIPKFSPDSSEGEKHLDAIRHLAIDEVRAIGIGEIGFDYHGDFKTSDDYENQKKWFVAEMNLARELNLPIVVHSRDACKDTLDAVTEYGKDLGGIIHCFSYEVEVAKEYVDRGYFIGIGGTLTFKNARKVKEVVELIPIENIVTETDAPWLSPMPYRGERNNSSNIKYVIDEIAKIKQLSVENVSEILYKNALRAYRIDDKEVQHAKHSRS